MLNVPRSWLRDRVSARTVPHTRLGRHVRFTEQHLAQIIANGEEPSLSTPVPTGGRHRRRTELTGQRPSQTAASSDSAGSGSTRSASSTGS